MGADAIVVVEVIWKMKWLWIPIVAILIFNSIQERENEK